ncbi:MAG: PKD domain-containing protein [Bacteroidia bacterium]|nr:PKD domain-containing protein [Bacteroidia bacterium]
MKLLRLYLTLCLPLIIFQVSAQNRCANLSLSFNVPAQNGCNVPSYFSFANTSTGSLAATSTYLWRIDGVRVDSTFGTTPFNYAFPGPGTYTVRMVSRTPGGCRDSIQQTVTITSGAALIFDGFGAFTFNPRWSNCIINPLQSSNYSIQVSSNAVLNNYTIIWGDNTPNNSGASLPIGSTVNHTYTTLGLFPIRIVTVNGGCTDTIRGTVINMRPVSTSIKPLPAGQLAGCAPHTITFQDTTQFALPGTIFTWNFGDGTIVTRDWTQANQPITHTYLPSPTGNCVYTVSLSAINTNCNTGANNASVFTISPVLIFDKDVARINPPTNLCAPSLTYTFGNSSEDNCITGTRYYYWDFGDGTNTGWITSKGPQTHTFPSLGPYTIMLIDSNGCGSDTTFTTVLINRPPVPGFTLTPKFGCAPLTITVNDTSLGIGNSRVWTFPGTTPGTGTNLIENRTFNNPGTYVVSLQVSNTCANNVIVRDTVRVFAKPSVNIGNVSSGCVPHTISPTNNTVNISNNATFFWDFGNGQTSTLRNPTPVTFNLTGNYQIKLVVRDTCGVDSQIVNIAVSTLPVASFTAGTVCRGSATNFNSNSTLATGDVITRYRWLFGNGDSIPNGAASVNYTYPASGTFTAILEITTDKTCRDTAMVNVTVKSSPTISISPTPTSICNGGIVSFNGTANTAAPATLTAFRWTFGTGDTARVEDTVYRFPSTGTYSVSFYAENNVGCSTAITQNYVVHPNPDARLFRSLACTGQQTRFTDSSVVASGNITQWAWDFNNDGIIDSTTRNPSFIFPSAGTFRTKLTVTTNNGCTNTDSINTIVNTTPLIQLNSQSALCAGDTFTFNNTSVGAFIYRYNFGDGSGDIILNATGPFPYIYSDSGTFTVQLLGITLQGCRDSVSRTVISRPLPEARFVMNDTFGCAPKLFTFTNQSVKANTYRWLVNGEPTSTLTNRSDTTVSLSNQQFLVSLVAFNQFNCRPDTAVQTVRTLSNPVPNFTISRDSGCGPLAVQFLNTTPNGISYRWNLGNGTQSTNVNATAVYPASINNDSVFTIKLIAENGPGCSDSITKTVRVFPKPISVFSPSINAGCGPLAVNFSNTSVHRFGGNISNMSFNWNFGNNQTSSLAQPSVTLQPSNSQDTNYTIRLIATSRFGCSDTSNQSIRVFPQPLSRFTAVNPAGCGPHQTTFNNTSIPNDTGSIGIMNFQWNFGNGLTSTIAQPTSTFIASNVNDSIYQIRLIAFSEHGCSDTTLQQVRVYPKPVAFFTPSTNAGCGPLQVQFLNQSYPNDTGTVADMTFNWNFGNGLTSTNTEPQAVFLAKILADTSYRVLLTATSEHGCVDTTSRFITVRPNPVTSFVPSVNAGCGPLQVQFNNTSQLGFRYYWDFNDGDTSMRFNPSHRFLSYDVFDSAYVVSMITQSVFGCWGDTARSTIVARYNPVADFLPSHDSICGNGNITFFNSSLGGTTHQWNFGNGTTSTAVNPLRFFVGSPTRDTVFQVRLVTTSPYGCRDTFIRPVTLNPNPDARFVHIPPGCSPYTVTFNNTGLRGVRYDWDFGDGSTDTAANPTKLFDNPLLNVNRIYPVTLRAYSNAGCTDTAKNNIVVYPLPVSQFSATKTLRCDTAEYRFLNTSQGASTYQWRFGDGQQSTLFVPVHYYRSKSNGDTLYQPRLIATTINGCRDTSSSTIVVNPLVSAEFDANVTQSCANLDVTFFNRSTNASSYFWFFGDGGGTNQINPTHKYVNTGAYEVRLIAYAATGCSDTAVKSAYINIHEVPTAQFIANPPIAQMPDANIRFTDISLLSSGTLSHQWNFGDGFPGSSSVLQHPQHQYTDSGNYLVRLIIETDKGCKDTAFRSIRVMPRKPIPAFSMFPKEGCRPLTVQFINESQYATAYRWDFGDGTRSTEENPTKTYTRDDKFTVELIAYGPGGDSTIEKVDSIIVHDLPRARFTINPSTIFLPEAISTFTNTSFDAVVNRWYLFDSLNNIIFTDTNVNSSYRFSGAGRYTLKLVVFNEFNCTDSSTVINAITVDDAATIFVPTAFTPDGNNVNDVFIPVYTGINLEGYEFRVYDRWGKLVFKTNNPYEAWNGETGGRACASDVYVWIVEGSFVSGNKFIREGNVTLLR